MLPDTCEAALHGVRANGVIDIAVEPCAAEAMSFDQDAVIVTSGSIVFSVGSLGRKARPALGPRPTTAVAGTRRVALTAAQQVSNGLVIATRDDLPTPRRQADPAWCQVGALVAAPTVVPLICRSRNIIRQGKEERAQLGIAATLLEHVGDDCLVALPDVFEPGSQRLFFAGGKVNYGLGCLNNSRRITAVTADRCT